MESASYSLFLPFIQTTSVIFASPHSGRNYSRDFIQMSILDDQALRLSEDAFMDVLAAPVVNYGSPLLVALVPRAFVDLNRDVDELDPALIEGVKGQLNNFRVSSGLGVIPRVVSNRQEIYRGKISIKEVNWRIKSYWEPYHVILTNLIQTTQKNFGQSILVDCHSMPSAPVKENPQTLLNHPEVVLGDRFGSSTSPLIADRIEGLFKKSGLTVGKNIPFSGAFITQQYGRPCKNKHAVQIELNRSLYLDEDLIQPSSNFAEFKNLLSTVFKQISDMGRDHFGVDPE